MSTLALHHVAIIITDLEKSLLFYRTLFGLTEIQRPDFTVAGAWLACGDLQAHLVVHPTGSFRTNSRIDRNDWHFAFRTDDFDGTVSRLASLGYTEDLPEDDPKHVLISRTGIAGFPQLYLCDPDSNVVEINGAH